MATPMLPVFIRRSISRRPRRHALGLDFQFGTFDLSMGSAFRRELNADTGADTGADVEFTLEGNVKF